jgi:hypothetical protein
LTKSLTNYKANEKLLDDEGFKVNVDHVISSHKAPEVYSNIEDRVQRFEADYRGKLGVMENIL